MTPVTLSLLLPARLTELRVNRPLDFLDGFALLKKLGSPPGLPLANPSTRAVIFREATEQALVEEWRTIALTVAKHLVQNLRVPLGGGVGGDGTHPAKLPRIQDGAPLTASHGKRAAVTRMRRKPSEVPACSPARGNHRPQAKNYQSAFHPPS